MKLKKLFGWALLFLSAFALSACSEPKQKGKEKKNRQQLVIAVPRLEVDVRLSEPARKYLQQTYDDEVFVQMKFYFSTSVTAPIKSMLPAYNQLRFVGSQLLVKEGRFASRFHTLTNHTMTVMVVRPLEYYRGMDYDVDFQVWNGSKSGTENVLQCPPLRTTVKQLQAKKMTLVCRLKSE